MGWVRKPCYCVLTLFFPCHKELILLSHLSELVPGALQPKYHKLNWKTVINPALREQGFICCETRERSSNWQEGDNREKGWLNGDMRRRGCPFFPCILQESCPFSQQAVDFKC